MDNPLPLQVNHVGRGHGTPPRTGIEGLPRFLTMADVRQLAGGVSRTTIYSWISAGHFPKSRKIGPRRVGWAAREVEAWAHSKMAA
jgi:prophage regulatory protein